MLVGERRKRMFKLRLPSPAIVIACVALLVSMSGTAIAASPVVKRALFANNAGKLQGKSSVEIAGLPGPASTAAGLLSTKTMAESLGPDSGREFTIGCDAGKKIVSGGYSTTGSVLPFDSRPTSETTWGMFLANLSSSQGATVTVYAVCLG
jgi:hypothetical protein